MSFLAKGNFNYRINDKSQKNSKLQNLYDEFTTMADKLSNLLNMKEKTIGHLSRELRSPLASQLIAIEMEKELLELHALSLENLSRIEQENIYLNGIITKILEFSKLQASDTTLKTDKVNLTQLIKHIISDIHFEYKCQCIVFKANDEYQVIAEKLLLRQAIENIIRNSIKYAGTHDPINISLKRQREFIYVTISDHSPGVLNHNVELLFTPFFREKRQKNNVGYGYKMCLNTH